VDERIQLELVSTLAGIEDEIRGQKHKIGKLIALRPKVSLRELEYKPTHAAPWVQDWESLPSCGVEHRLALFTKVGFHLCDDRREALLSFGDAFFWPLPEERLQSRSHLVHISRLHMNRAHDLLAVRKLVGFKHRCVILYDLVQKVLIEPWALFEPGNPLCVVVKLYHLELLLTHQTKVAVHSRNVLHRLVLVEEVRTHDLAEVCCLLVQFSLLLLRSTWL
jgi:hypothetical protein